MGRKRKFLVTDNARIDLSTHRWDDNLFSNLLVKENRIEKEKFLPNSPTLMNAGP
jgi:hypothetical protein